MRHNNWRKKMSNTISQCPHYRAQIEREIENRHADYRSEFLSNHGREIAFKDWVVTEIGALQEDMDYAEHTDETRALMRLEIEILKEAI